MSCERGHIFRLAGGATVGDDPRLPSSCICDCGEMVAVATTRVQLEVDGIGLTPVLQEQCTVSSVPTGGAIPF